MGGFHLSSLIVVLVIGLLIYLVARRYRPVRFCYLERG